MVLTVNARYVDLGFCWTSTLGTWIRGGVDSQRLGTWIWGGVESQHSVRASGGFRSQDSVRVSGVASKEVNARYVDLGFC